MFYSKLNGLPKIPLMFLIDLMTVSQISSKDKIINYWQVINYWQITLSQIEFFLFPQKHLGSFEPSHVFSPPALIFVNEHIYESYQ